MVRSGMNRLAMEAKGLNISGPTRVICRKPTAAEIYSYQMMALIWVKGCAQGIEPHFKSTYGRTVQSSPPEQITDEADTPIILGPTS